MPADIVNIPELAAEFTAAHPTFDPAQQRLALATFRALAAGAPATPEQLAERAALPAADVRSYLDTSPMVQRAQHGGVIAFAGLTLKPTSHALDVDGRSLYAWCALDSLFLPELIGRPARIHSTDPETGQTISLAVDADGVHDIVPEGAVMSIRGARGFDVNQAIRTFCSEVHFFAREDAARAWTSRREGTSVASIGEGFEYGRLYNHARFRDTLAALER
jgi:alkylmercury lyase